MKCLAALAAPFQCCPQVEPEDAQLLVAATGLGDARHPRDGRLAHWAAAELPLVGDSFWPVVAFRGWQQSANSVEKFGSSRLPAY
ncbi:hypothetical protein [Pseudomonas sp. Leaf48]|uniref:hypothetical protein n=1 Tax=Pseudomonas sp. Leaf48 TaxID=1736221 RepID=UPI0015A74F36|nr:hypothetical protein [Pseudomonas sp. Leaf48]